jgi:hypothetical protein
MLFLLLISTLSTAPIALVKKGEISFRNIDIEHIWTPVIVGNTLYFSDDALYKLELPTISPTKTSEALESNLVRFGKTGKGKGEFVAVNDLVAFNDALYVSDRANAKLVTFDLDGVVSGEIRFSDKNILPGTGLVVTNDGYLVMSSKYGPQGFLYFVGKDGSATPLPVVQYPEEYRFAMIYQSYFCFHEGDFFLAGIYNNNLTRFRKNGQVLATSKLQSEYDLKYESSKSGKDSRKVSIAGSTYLAKGVFVTGEYVIVPYSGTIYASVNKLRIYSRTNLSYLGEVDIAASIDRNLKTYLDVIWKNNLLYCLKAEYDKKSRSYYDYSFDVYGVTSK